MGRPWAYWVGLGARDMPHSYLSIGKAVKESEQNHAPAEYTDRAVVVMNWMEETGLIKEDSQLSDLFNYWGPGPLVAQLEKAEEVLAGTQYGTDPWGTGRAAWPWGGGPHHGPMYYVYAQARQLQIARTK